MPDLSTGPYILSQALDFHDAKTAVSFYIKRREEAQNGLQEATEKLAEAERVYRKARAEKRLTIDASSAGERDDKVDAATADARFQRDIAKGMVRAYEEKLRGVDGARAGLHRLISWSEEVWKRGVE